jgi:hypothetical protein
LNKARYSWWDDEDFMQSELGRFIEFVRGI